MSAKQLLTEAEIFPDNAVISAGLGAGFKAYELFMSQTAKLGIDVEWRYYNDSKAWLGKNTFKKKTVFWLSIWEGLFKISLFFTEKTRAGVYELAVSKEIKESLANQKPMGKLIPLVLELSAPDQLDDAISLVAYKQNLK